ncbi:hypothetical protein D910_00081 [Dendroctonus ponderosae]|uniref:Uncharacterized protein n=1 Tax=Dendroctonus ponderosae TaxID=77166 RepID=U4UZ27_DENPD|nr:hypothetical protein D910_00081 [Dendroctonus ponderosae]
MFTNIEYADMLLVMGECHRLEILDDWLQELKYKVDDQEVLGFRT